MSGLSEMGCLAGRRVLQFEKSFVVVEMSLVVIGRGLVVVWRGILQMG